MWNSPPTSWCVHWKDETGTLERRAIRGASVARVSRVVAFTFPMLVCLAGRIRGTGGFNTTFISHASGGLAAFLAAVVRVARNLKDACT